MSGSLRFTTSDYPFGIFNLLFAKTNITGSPIKCCATIIIDEDFLEILKLNILRRNFFNGYSASKCEFYFICFYLNINGMRNIIYNVMNSYRHVDNLMSRIFVFFDPTNTIHPSKKKKLWSKERI